MPMIIDRSSILRQSVGAEVQISGRMAFDGSYATGGEAFPLAQVGLNQITFLQVNQADGYHLEGVVNSTRSAATVQAFTVNAAGAAFGGNALAPHTHLFTEPYYARTLPILYSATAAADGFPLYVTYAESGVWYCFISSAAGGDVYRQFPFDTDCALPIMDYNVAPIVNTPATLVMAVPTVAPGQALLHWSGGNAPDVVNYVMTHGQTASVLPIQLATVPPLGRQVYYNILQNRLEADFADASSYDVLTRQSFTQPAIDGAGITEPESGGTPSGTLSGALTYSEVVNGTDLSGISNIAFVCQGL